MWQLGSKIVVVLVVSSALSGCAAGAVDLGARDRDGGPDGSRPLESEPCNGADDDLDTRIDEGCSCESGQTQACFGGEPSRRGVGACRDGVQTCTAGEFADWGNFVCTESVAPVDEQCGDRVDNDCDGEVDEDCGPRTLRAYIKASNSQPSLFGSAVAVSADGNVVAIGAPGDASSARGINGDAENSSAMLSGAVYVFRRQGTAWMQEAYVKASNAEAGDEFGRSVALSADGTLLAVGARYEDSAARGIGGDQDNNTAVNSGAVYIFRREEAWAQEAYIKASNGEGAHAGLNADHFGFSVSLSGDGSVLAVGALHENSAARGVDGNQHDNSLPASGAVYVFRRNGNAWTQESYIKASNSAAHDRFGYSVSVSTDGTRLAVGAVDQDDVQENSGAVYVFSRGVDGWLEEAYLKPSIVDDGDNFGFGVSLSDDGTELAVAALNESSASRTIDGDRADNSAVRSGAVYVFVRASDAQWTEQAYIKASNTDAEDRFGFGVALSGDGRTLAVGATHERSVSRGIDGDQTNNAGERVGAVYVFERSETGPWAQTSYLKAFNADNNDDFGVSVALDHSGATLVVGASGEASSGRGLDADPEDNLVPSAGAVYVYH